MRYILIFSSDTGCWLTGFLANKVKQLAVEIHFSPGDPLKNCQNKRVRILQ